MFDGQNAIGVNLSEKPIRGNAAVDTNDASGQQVGKGIRIARTDLHVPKGTSESATKRIERSNRSSTQPLAEWSQFCSEQHRVRLFEPGNSGFRVVHESVQFGGMVPGPRCLEPGGFVERKAENR